MNGGRRIRQQLGVVIVTSMLCMFTNSIAGQETATVSTAQHKTNDSAEENSKRVWGAASRDAQQQQQQDTNHSTQQPDPNDESQAETATTSGSGSKIPFIPKPKSQPYMDPFSKGFELKARVYTDPSDKLAHFDFDTPITFPYWECGVQGSSTAPIPLQHFSVRHMLGGSKPNSFTTGVGNSGEDFGRYGKNGANSDGSGSGGGSDDFGPNPQLLIPLCSIDVVLNSGETHTFEAGSVVLLENVLMGGHKLVGHGHHDMVALLLTLPYPYRHVGKERNSLTTMFAKTFWKQSPCRTGLSAASDGTSSYDGNSERSNGLAEFFMSAPHRGMRRVGLSILGAGMSLALADFVGKTAPFILAVMFGGGSLVLGCTFGVVKLGEYGMDQLELWNEKRLLRLEGNDIVRDGNSIDDDVASPSKPEVPMPEGERSSEGSDDDNVALER